MDMEQDWKRERTEAARVELVAQADQARRVTALEAALRYEVEASDRMRGQMMAAIECAASERASAAHMLAARERTMAEQASEIGALRHQLATAMRTIDSWSADRSPTLKPGLHRCDATFRGIDMGVDYSIVPGYDGSSDDCDAIEISAVWIGATEVSALLRDEAEESLHEQAQQALEDWFSDARKEIETAGVPSLREQNDVL